MRKLLLSSNGGFVIEKVFKLLFEDISKINLAYITTAAKGNVNKEYIENHKALLEKEGINYQELDIDGKNENELRELLENKDAVYMEGGNTFYLLKAVRESGFDKVIKELIEKGVPYIGSSAGSYIACPTIEMATWSLKQKDRFGVVEFSAMNLVPFLVKAHYEPEQEELLKDKISQSKYETKVLKDGQAILVEGDRYELVCDNEVDLVAINDWLKLFEESWINKDIESVMSLFSEDVEYFETPERKLKNKDEIKEEWEVVKEQDEIELELNLIGDIDGIYDVEWKLSYYKQGQMHKYKGIYKIRLNESGKCNYFMQIEK